MIELSLQEEINPDSTLSFWRNPIAWARAQDLSRGYWTFFAAAFFFDAGFSVYVFLFNLYLLDVHFNERAMGLIGGAMTLGGLLGTLPAGTLSKRFGVRPLLITCFVFSSFMGVLRAIWLWPPAQIALALLAGLSMSSWGVCFLPTVARLTTEKNRTSAFSLIFSVSIGTSALGGIICGYLPRWMSAVGWWMHAAEIKRLILLASCFIALIGLAPVLRLHLPADSPDASGMKRCPQPDGWFTGWKLSPFLKRYLPCMALWSAILAGFNPFANVYLSNDLHVPLTQIGLIFSISQIVQLVMGLILPILARTAGLLNGIVATQAAAAITLFALAGTRNRNVAIALYLGFSAMQWMSSPGLYNLLMNETPDQQRSTAAAMTMFCNAVVGSLATALAGSLFTRYGYSAVLPGIAGLALLVALLFRTMVAPQVGSDVVRLNVRQDKKEMAR